MKHLGTGLKFLTKLNKFIINLKDNYIGSNEENIRNLGDGIKQLHFLQYLGLYLSDNNIGGNGKNIM